MTYNELRKPLRFYEQQTTTVLASEPGVGVLFNKHSTISDHWWISAFEFRGFSMNEPHQFYVFIMKIYSKENYEKFVLVFLDQLTDKTKPLKDGPLIPAHVEPQVYLINNAIPSWKSSNSRQFSLWQFT